MVSQDQSNLVAVYMLNILVECINYDREVHEPILKLVLSQLMDTESEDQSRKMISFHIIKRCAEKLQPYIKMYLDQAFMLDEWDIQEQTHRLVIELHCIEPDLIVPIFPHLLRELEVENVQLRYLVVQMLMLMFANPESPNIPHSHRSLFFAFLKRFKDKLPTIREFLVQSVATFLEIQNDNTLIDPVLEQLESRLKDPDESIREQAVNLLCECAVSNPTKIHTAISELIMRMRDKSV